MGERRSSRARRARRVNWRYRSPYFQRLFASFGLRWRCIRTEFLVRTVPHYSTSVMMALKTGGRCKQALFEVMSKGGRGSLRNRGVNRFLKRYTEAALRYRGNGAGRGFFRDHQFDIVTTRAFVTRAGAWSGSGEFKRDKWFCIRPRLL